MINPNKVNLIIFDMDGTIVPSLRAVYNGLKKVFAEFGWKFTYSEDDICQLIGTTSGDFYQRITPQEYFSQWAELRDRARSEYASLFRESSETFPGVRGTLAMLRKRGYKLVLYSNASVQYFDIIISSLKIRDYFDYTECIHENNLPKPDLVRKIREKFNGLTAAIVGDRFNDIEAARENDSMSVGVLFGYGGSEPEKADMTISRFDDLLKIFDSRI